MTDLEIRPYTIAVIGSSTAAGHGASTQSAAWANKYEIHLRELHPESEVYNLGKGGYSTYQLLPDDYGPTAARPIIDTLRNISKALKVTPDAVVINLPSNDTASGHDAEEQVNNLLVMARDALNAGALPFVCTTQPRSFPQSKTKVQQEVRDKILETFGVYAIDLWSPLASEDDATLKQDFDSGDGTHLNDAGHQVVFNKVVEKNIPLLVTQYKTGQLPLPAIADIQVRKKRPFFSKMFGWIVR